MSSKAATAIRRSGVRIRSLGSGHTPLNLVISDLSSVRQKLKDNASACQRAGLSQQKWGEDENPALQDILRQLNELTELFLEAQQEYIASMKEYKRVYESILASEKKLDQARKQVITYEEKERKYEKELSKGSKDPETAKLKLKRYQEAKELAMAEVVGQERETEAIKMMSVKGGLLDHSRAWLALSQKSSIFAEAQKELALLIPDISPQTDIAPPYNGSRESKAIMRDVRIRLSETVPSYQSSAASSFVLSPPSSSYSSPSVPKTLPSYEQDNDSFDSFDES